MIEHGVIARQLSEMQSKWPDTTAALQSDGSTLVCVPDVKLPAGAWNQPSATIWLVLPCGFPLASPENFFVRHLRLAHGGDPGHTSTMGPTHHSRGLGWTKCFNRPLRWDPNSDTITTWVHVCQRWLHTKSAQVLGCSDA
jgi:hypothetical protein